jgi:cystinosin
MVGWYPQLITNFASRSVAGVSLDNIALNALGFACYASFNCALTWSPTVRGEYRDAHGGLDPGGRGGERSGKGAVAARASTPPPFSLPRPDVRSNDVFFALHALLCTLLSAFQAARYDRGGQRVSGPTGVAVATAVAAVAAAAAAAAANWCHVTPLTVLYIASYIKVGTTAAKYAPQLRLNARRASTAGYNIASASTDLAGGALSLAQQVLDAAIFRDASLIVGNPAKLALSTLSMLFCAALMVQHYCHYRFVERGGVYEPLSGLLPRASHHSQRQPATRPHLKTRPAPFLLPPPLPIAGARPGCRTRCTPPSRPRWAPR